MPGGDDEQKAIATNRRARHDYEILERVEAGLVLLGPEVKSLRAGKASLTDAYALIRRGELARGLAYWASSYEELPARQRAGPQFQTFASALAEVPLYWEAFGHRPDGRNIVDDYLKRRGWKETRRRASTWPGCAGR